MANRRADLDVHARDRAMCSYCPKMCRAVCPVGLAETRETTTTWGKMWQAFRVVEHGDALDPEVAAVFDACTGCGACTAFCEHGVDAAAALFAMRARAYEGGVSARAEALADRHDALGRCCELDLTALYAAELDHAPGPVALLPGSSALRRRPGLARLARQVLLDAGVRCASLPVQARGLDVGQDLLWAGLAERFVVHARRVAQALEGVATVICLDPEDAYFLTVSYRGIGVAIEARVTTAVEELARVLDHLPERPGSAVAYHDPCFLGRRLGVYSAPRRVIARVLGSPPLEFAWNREHSECCGGGGLYPDANADGALAAARRRWNSLPAGAEGIVTACPSAEVSLLEAGADVRDVMELVAGQRIG